jgi:hypothetical protein
MTGAGSAEHSVSEASKRTAVRNTRKRLNVTTPAAGRAMPDPAAESSIIWAKFSVETGCCRTLG